MLQAINIQVLENFRLNILKNHLKSFLHVAYRYNIYHVYNMLDVKVLR